MFSGDADRPTSERTPTSRIVQCSEAAGDSRYRARPSEFSPSHPVFVGKPAGKACAETPSSDLRGLHLPKQASQPILLEATIDAKGRVKNVALLRQHSDLKVNQLFLDTARGWLFRPAKQRRGLRGKQTSLQRDRSRHADRLPPASPRLRWRISSIAYAGGLDSTRRSFAWPSGVRTSRPRLQSSRRSSAWSPKRWSRWFKDGVDLLLSVITQAAAIRDHITQRQRRWSESLAGQRTKTPEVSKQRAAFKTLSGSATGPAAALARVAPRRGLGAEMLEVAAAYGLGQHVEPSQVAGRLRAIRELRAQRVGQRGDVEKPERRRKMGHGRTLTTRLSYEDCRWSPTSDAARVR